MLERGLAIIGIAHQPRLKSKPQAPAMEGAADASFNWEWQSELLSTFDASSPLGTTHTLWEDLDQAERDMLDATPASKLGRDHSDDFLWDFKEDDNSHNNELSHEDNLHLKRRRMLQFGGEEDIGLFTYDPSLDTAFNSLQRCAVLEEEDAHMYERESTTPLWLDTNLDDCSSMDMCDDHNWQDGSSKHNMCEPHEAPSQLKNRQETPMTNLESSSEDSKAEWEIHGKRRSNRASHIKRSIPDQKASSTKATIPVAYPFTVVKPSGIQGDITLNDINQHIMRVHTKSTHPGRFCHEGHGGPFATTNVVDKEVLALTKIHTQGNGTITIMRTKN